MKKLSLCLFLFIPALLHAQSATLANQKFASGGTIRLHLEAGGYSITSSDSENIVVRCRTQTDEELRHLKVEIKSGASTADVYVSKTPHNNFKATIEVPQHSNLWAKLSAGELEVADIKGDKDIELRAGRLQINIPHPEQYGHRYASVWTGSIESSAFQVSKGGLFRSFEQEGPGSYQLRAHVTTGEIDLPKD